MLVFWKGNGILWPLAAIVGGVAGALVAQKFDFGSDYQPILVGILICTWGYTLTIGKTNTSIAIAAAGQRKKVRHRNTLYFIPVFVWSILLTIAFLPGLLISPSDFNLNDSGSFRGAGTPDTLKKADRWLRSSEQPHFRGNTLEAREMAKQFSAKLWRLREIGIEPVRDRTRRISDTSQKYDVTDCRTYCYLIGGRCAFVTALPDLPNLADDAEDYINTAAWEIATSLAAGATNKPDRVAVGMRSFGRYSAIMVGSTGEAQPRTKGKASELKNFFSSASKEQTPSEERTEKRKTKLPTELMVWEAADGRELKAVLVGFTDAKQDKAEFVREDGKTYEIALDQFAPHTQKTIRTLADDSRPPPAPEQTPP